MKYLLILLAFTLTASARLGENTDECNKRYGKTVIKVNKHKMKYAKYQKNGFIILCLFDDKDKCVFISYVRKRPSIQLLAEYRKIQKELKKINIFNPASN